MLLTVFASPLPLRRGLEKDLGDAGGKVISGGNAEDEDAAAESNASGIELREVSTRGRTDEPLPPPPPPPAPALLRCGAPDEECEAPEAAEAPEGGVEGEGVEKRRREGEESTAKSGSVSEGRSRSSPRRLPPAIDEEEVEDAEEEEE